MTSNSFQPRGALRRLRPYVAAVALVAFLPMATTACFGDFRLTKKVYKFNQEIDPDKWIQWFAFVVMSIIPIYGFAGVVDTVVANSIEFWTGENPITADAGTVKVVRGPNGERIELRQAADGALEVVVADTAGSVRELRFVREAGALSAWDVQGRLLARVTDVAGQPAVIAGSLAPAH